MDYVHFIDGIFFTLRFHWFTFLRFRMCSLVKRFTFCKKLACILVNGFVYNHTRERFHNKVQCSQTQEDHYSAIMGLVYDQV